MTKLEDLTKALLKRRYYDCEPEMYESEEAFYASLDAQHLYEARDEVEAVVKAMREPPQRYMEQNPPFVITDKRGKWSEWYPPNEVRGAIWSNMIDHLLSEAGERA